MAHSQLAKIYKVFNTKVEKPYELARELSNGDLIGRCYQTQKDGLTVVDIEKYIKENHVEPTIDF